jgi:hypothetical protein
MDKAQGLPRLFSEEQLAEHLAHIGVTTRDIATHRKAGTLKATTISKNKFGYREEAVITWLMSLEDKCVTRRTSYLNTAVGGSSSPPTALSSMEPDTTREAEESAAKALAQTILKPPKMH